MAKKQSLNPVHPALAAAWKDTLFDRLTIEMQNIEGIDVDEDLARQWIEHVASSYKQLLEDIEGKPL